MATASGREKMPFIVEIISPWGNREEIQVLGTHFNISAYGNENNVKTTLLEGSVKFSSNYSTVIIKPEEQAILDNRLGKVPVANADVEELVAWKDHFFSFKYANIETIMRQVVRWYDVDVVYNNGISKGQYWGDVSRNVNASKMLKVLEPGGIHFKIEGEKIIVM